MGFLCAFEGKPLWGGPGVLPSQLPSHSSPDRIEWENKVERLLGQDNPPPPLRSGLFLTLFPSPYAAQHHTALSSSC